MNITQYRDLDFNFRPHPVTKDLAIIKNENAVKKSVSNLLRTRFFDRAFRPELGSGIYNALFTQSGIMAEKVIIAEVQQVLLKYEPRIIINEIKIRELSSELGYKVSVTFSLINNFNDITVEVLLKQIT